MRLVDNLQSFLIVAFGAILGSNIRFIIYQKLAKIKLKKNYRILLINSFSSFLAGLIYSISLHITHLKYSDELLLFFLIGVLGSFSTFSTFVYDLFDLSTRYKFYRTLKLFIFSLSSGMISLALGFLLGNQ